MQTRKTDNHNLRAKLELRRHFLRLAKFTKPFSVLDCFSGGETIWKTLRNEFDVGEYLALDVKQKRGRLKLDSLRYLQTQQWTHDVIDLDSYGSPWRHFFEVCKRGRSVIVFLTIGETIFRRQQNQALSMAGISFAIPPAIAGQLAEEVFAHCASAPLRADLQIDYCAEALNPGGNARYIGLKISRKTRGVGVKHVS